MQFQVHDRALVDRVDCWFANEKENNPKVFRERSRLKLNSFPRNRTVLRSRHETRRLVPVCNICSNVRFTKRVMNTFTNVRSTTQEVEIQILP